MSTLCYRARSHQLSILYIASRVYRCQSQSPSSSPSPRFPPWCPYISSLCLCVCFYFENKIIYTFFLDSTYMCWYTIFFFFFLLTLNSTFKKPRLWHTLPSLHSKLLGEKRKRWWQTSAERRRVNWAIWQRKLYCRKREVAAFREKPVFSLYSHPFLYLVDGELCPEGRGP